MSYRCSGVLAVLVSAAGMLWSCSENSDGEVFSPDQGDSSSESSSPFLGENQSSTNQCDSTLNSCNFVSASSGSHSDSEINRTGSSGTFAGVSSASEMGSGNSSGKVNPEKNPQSSSSTSFEYVAPSAFADTVNGAIFNMVYVPGGSYTRGCDNCEEQDKIYEAPSHKVTVSDFHIATTEVTNAQWNAVMGGTKNVWESDKAPKIGVSWFDANDFACKLGKLTGHNYRLLTDAEWEFAARGGKEGIADNFKFSGSNTLDDVSTLR